MQRHFAAFSLSSVLLFCYARARHLRKEAHACDFARHEAAMHAVTRF